MAYLYSRTLTIDKSKVPNTDQVNFPVLFSGTYDYLAHMTHGGKVTNLNGYDIIFTSDSVGNTKLDHEIERYNHETGAVTFWVRVPTVATASDTVIYLWYGNSAINTSQEVITGVWNSGYKVVYHLPDGTNLASPTLDSTDQNNDGTLGGATGTPVAGDGKCDGGAVFVAANKQSITTPAINLGTVFSVEAWVKVSGTPTSYARVAENAYNTGFYLGSNAGTLTVCFIVKADFNVNGGLFVNGEWVHIAGVYDGTTAFLYVAGVPVDSGLVANPTIGSAAIKIGVGATVGESWNGILDEIRFSTVARSADWILTEYNNQSSPNTFYALGNEIAGGLSIPENELAIYPQPRIEKLEVVAY